MINEEIQNDLNQSEDDLIDIPSFLSMARSGNDGIALAADCWTNAEGCYDNMYGACCQGSICQGQTICVGCNQGQGCTTACQVTTQSGCTTCQPVNQCAATCIPAYQCGTCQIQSQTCTTTCEANCQTGCQVAAQAIHRVAINNTSYQLDRGRTLVGGTGYDVKKGRVLISNTGYDIALKSEKKIYDGGSTVLSGTFYPIGYALIAPSIAAATIKDGYIVTEGIASAVTNPSTGQIIPVVDIQFCAIGPIDFTDFKTLHFEGYTTFSASVGYNNSKPTSPVFTNSAYLLTTSSEVTLDISKVTGDQYIIFAASASSVSKGYLSKIWLTQD